MRNPYEILGVQRDATLEEIKRAYRSLALLYHPDRNQGDERTADLFRDAILAYEILTNPREKAKIDREFEPVRSVEELFLHHEAGRKVMTHYLPHAKREAVPGFTRFAIVSASDVSEIGNIVDVKTGETSFPVSIPPEFETCSWGVISGLGASGKNNAISGDILIKISGKRNKTSKE